MLSRFRAPIIAAALAAQPLAPLFGWGVTGHRAIAMIAERRLTPQAREEVRRLLLNDRYSLADISVCADVVRDKTRPSPHREMCETLAGSLPPTNAAWHYIDIPSDVKHESPLMRYCPGDNCAVARIKLFAETLRSSKDDARRRAALLFLVHLMGDIHQPLHAIERACDKGGNKERVNFYLGKKEFANESLHWTWDSHMVDKYMADRRLDGDAALANALSSKIGEPEARKWARAGVDEIAWESHAIAQKNVYTGIPFQNFCDAQPEAAGANKIVTDLPSAYERNGAKIVHERIAKAGVRLAALLNSALAEGAAVGVTAGITPVVTRGAARVATPGAARSRGAK